MITTHNQINRIINLIMANDMSVKELLQIILFYLIWLQNMLLKDVKV